MNDKKNRYELRLACDAHDLLAVQRLRYKVFIEEMGGNGPLVDHDRRLERDGFDDLCDHLLLIDRRSAGGDNPVVGCYRLLRGDMLAQGQAFYSEGEYDLAALRQTGRSLLEVGRSCVHPDHRGGASMVLLWNKLAEYVLEHGVEIMFGTASFAGTDYDEHSQALAFLQHHHLAPPDLRADAIGAGRADIMPFAGSDAQKAQIMKNMPALIKAYLRLGGYIGKGAWIDRDFKTIDVLLVMDTKNMSPRHLDYYLRRNGEKHD